MITNDYILQEDLDNIAKELKIIKTLRNSTIFITGATGLVDCLLYVHYLIIMIWMVQVIRS